MDKNWQKKLNPALKSIFKLQNIQIPKQKKKKINIATARTFFNFISKQINKNPPQIDQMESFNNIKIFYPKNVVSNTPVVFYIHGGGFHFLNLAFYHKQISQLVTLCNVIVAAIEYRLAPEFPYPIGLQDCITGFQICLNKFQGRDFWLYGDSAGANLCVYVSLQAQFLKKIKGLILVYPWLDLSLSTNSYKDYDNYLQKNEILTQIIQSYLNGQVEANSPQVSPIFLSDNEIKNIPQTLLISSGLDKFIDESIIFASMLERNNVVCKHKIFDDMVHGFLVMSDFIPEIVNEVYKEISRCINIYSKLQIKYQKSFQDIESCQ